MRHTDDSCGETRVDADAPMMLHDVELTDLGLVDGSYGHVDRLAVPLHAELHRLPCPPCDHVLHFGKARDRLPIDAHDSVVRLEFAVGGFAGVDHTDGGRKKLIVLEKHRHVERDWKE